MTDTTTTTATTTSTEPLLLLMEDVQLALGPRGGETLRFALDRLELAAGGKLALVGPSGCGKTTLLHLATGLLRPHGGRISLAGTEIARMPPRRLDRHRGANVGLVFQQFNLLDDLSALENVLAGLRFSGTLRGGHKRDRAREALVRVGLEKRLHHRPRQLSVGERQRVAIARALAVRPRLIAADEPTGALDPANAEAVFALLLEVCEEAHCALLLVTHDHALADRLGERMDCTGLVHEVRGATA